MSDFFHSLSQSSVTPEEKTAEFMDAAEVFTSYKSKIADFEDEHGTGGPISKEEVDKLLYVKPPTKTAAPVGLRRAFSSPAVSTGTAKAATTPHKKKKDTQQAAKLPKNLKTRISSTARHRYPTNEPVSKEVKGVWGSLRNKFREYMAARSAMGVRPVIPTPISSVLSKEAGLEKMIPSYLKTRTGVGVTAATAAAFGIGNYIANMPRESLGGKGKAQVHFEGKVRANEAEGLEGAGLSKKFRNRMAEFQKGLATDFSKHPRGAAATGALVGMSVGSQVARIVQGIR